MITSMTDLLAQEGFGEHSKLTPGQIHGEKYWNEATKHHRHGEVLITSKATARPGSTEPETGE
jgi:hypothetical protein